MKTKIIIQAGDVTFQESLTPKEQEYISEGCNWISKLERETRLKSLHHIGLTLDKVASMPKDRQDRIFRRAAAAWNKSIN